MTNTEVADNAEQREYWNGEAGERWAQQDEMMAALLEPIARSLLEHADLSGVRGAVDIGCGGGSQSLLLAERLGPSGRVLGVDISGPLLAVARERAATASANAAAMDFVHADATSYTFEPGAFDLLFSRFGVMFFDDPVAAFTNLRSALGANGKLAFTCWQSVQDNPWIWLALQAALRFVPPPEAADPDAPGPFSFADPSRLKSVLGDAGFRDIAIEHHPVTLRWAAADTLAGNVAGLIQMGPVSSLLVDQDDTVRQQVLEAVVEVMGEFYHDDALNLPAAAWLVTASI
jgi:ubiquinone/menaquinone biosynthesis C-methylase UbiE